MLTGLSEAGDEDGLLPDPGLELACDGEERGAGLEPSCPTSVFAGGMSR